MDQSVSGAMLNGFTGARIDSLDARTSTLLERRSQALSPGYKLLYERPLEVVRAAGRFMYDADGHAYLDAYNNVASLGHCHPRVVEAVQSQVALLNTNTRYLDTQLLSYTERLLATHEDDLDRAAFTCTGSEAVDLALRVARRLTGKRGVVVTANAYHGMTEAVAAISPSLGRNVPLDPSVRVVQLELDDERREVSASALTRAVLAAVDDLDRCGVGTAAFIADSIFSTDGLLPGPRGFLQPLSDALRRRNVLFIADEVQAGFGRTGSHMWGYQRHGVVPDIVAMGKPMGNGMPIAGIVAKHGVIEEFGQTARYFNTFGANSVSIAAASAVLDVIEDEGLLAACAATGEVLARGLEVICARHSFMGTARSAGLYIGIDVNAEGARRSSDAALASDLVNRLRDNGVLISTMGPQGNVLKIRPPLTLTENEVAFFLDQFESVLQRL